MGGFPPCLVKDQTISVFSYEGFSCWPISNLNSTKNVRYYWHSYVDFFLHIYIASAIRKYKWLLDFRFKFRKIQWKLFEFCASNQTTFGYYFNPICHGGHKVPRSKAFCYCYLFLSRKHVFWFIWLLLLRGWTVFSKKKNWNFLGEPPVRAPQKSEKL